MRLLICAWVMVLVPQRLPTPTISASGPASSRISRGTRSSCRMTFPARNTVAALTVSRSAAPGPAPTIETLPVITLCASPLNFCCLVFPVLYGLHQAGDQFIHVANHVEPVALVFFQHFF